MRQSVCIDGPCDGETVVVDADYYYVALQRPTSFSFSSTEEMTVQDLEVTTFVYRHWMLRLVQGRDTFVFCPEDWDQETVMSVVPDRLRAFGELPEEKPESAKSEAPCRRT